MGRKQALENYTEVKDRIKLYKEEFPDYRVETQLIFNNDNADVVIVKASLYRNIDEQERDLPHATGIAEETRDAGYINKTSHVENCETSAIGRALANADFSGSDKRPSREEMSKVERTKKAKEKKPEPEITDVEQSNDSDVDYLEMINSFSDSDDLVAWFNSELDARKGENKNEFKDQYLKAVRERVTKLYED